MANDQIRIGARTNAANFNLLSAQWVEWMGDRYPSQGRLG
jgi:hypothetical protein